MKNLYTLPFLIVCFLTACNSKVSSTSIKPSDKDSINNPTQKNTFKLGSVLFTKRTIDTNIKVNNIKSIIPSSFKKVENLNQIKFDVNFNKDYYVINNKITSSLLTNDSFFHEIFFSNYKILNLNTDTFNPFLDAIAERQFAFSNVEIINYGKCFIGIISTQWSNSIENNCMIVINNTKMELSIWSYDEFKFDKQGNIFSLFRLKDRRTWYYYNYDTASNCFIPVATKYWKLYDN